MLNNEFKVQVFDFISDYLNHRKNNPIDSIDSTKKINNKTTEYLDLSTAFDDRNNGYCYEIDWYFFRYDDPRCVYEITIDIDDILGDVVVSNDTNEGFEIIIKPETFIYCKNELIKLLDWTVRNFSNIKHKKEIFEQASILINKVRKK